MRRGEERVRAEDEEADETREGKGRTGKRTAAQHTRGTQTGTVLLGLLG
jgi:hypothetical protein